MKYHTEDYRYRQFGNYRVYPTDGVVFEQMLDWFQGGSYQAQDQSNADDIAPSAGSNKKIIPWGNGNDMPERIQKAVINTSIASPLLNFRAVSVVSKGLNMYEWLLVEQGKNKPRKKIKDPVIDDQLEEWLEAIGVPKFLREAARDGEYLKNIFAEVVMSRDGRNVNHLKRLDASLCRVAENNKGIFVYKDWQSIAKHKNYEYIPFYDPEMFQPKFCLHAKNSPLGSSTYGIADWIGALNWMEILQEVSKWKLNAIKNGFNIKYHIQYPSDYFLKNYTPEIIKAMTKGKVNTQAGYETFRLEEKERIFNEMRKYLSGAKGAHNSFFSAFSNLPGVKESSGWKIIALPDNTNYTAWLEDVNTATGQTISAIGVHPSLANVLVEGKLSSGSDLRNAFNIFMNIMTIEARELLLEIINPLKRFQFPDKAKIKLGFENIQLTTLEESKTGVTDKEPSTNN